ncbi:3-phytase [Dolichospermum sp. UHCC 0315A]|uniref:5'/3'-nucleotidase SurE n=1 Tax=Dolichospermum sp. UHCC 0315A TaxID=1914871 RepID=UPI0012521A9F|nr:5'/3'-nucleotidase SurE [Dolichospermum sp. UHCC 0315A]QEI43442.1 3-phytase [Dolichospermum sp. UHCC 0315A]
MVLTTVRFSQFNASLNRNTAGQLVTDLSTPNNAQAKTVAEIIQRNNPDVLLINEFDYSPAAVNLFRQNYLQISQNGATPVNYSYFYISPSNTGIASGFDLNNNGTTVTTPGTTGYGDDAFGFGNFPGQFGMLLLSKYPIDTANVRTFQNFLWKDMPGNLLTNDPTVDNSATSINENLNGFYSPEEINVLRLSSKSHWDVPITVNGETVHVLVSHPTPPTFDGTEDRNGKRNSDEIRFWADYITPGKGDYIYDDGGKKGNLAAGSSFVIMGDQNADPLDGDSYNNAIRQLLLNPSINTNVIPTSLGAPQQATLQGQANNNHKGNPAFDTADFADTAPGNLRTDYVLPSSDLQISKSEVYWPSNTDPNFPLVGTFNSSLPGGFPSSDHRLIYADVQVGETEPGKTAVSAGFKGQTIFNTGFIPSGAAGTVNGQQVALGGLSGVTYDAVNNRYYAISDDRSQNARFYTFTLDHVTNTVTFTNVVQLKDINGNPFAANSLDPEGIALTSNGTVFISSEGEVRPDLGASRVTNPFIKEFNLTTGQEIRSLAVPKKFNPVVQDTNNNNVVDTGDTQTSGVRNNLAFESLTITPDQKTLFTATESALFQDGAISTTTTSSRSRIIQYNLVTGQPEKEYLYITDPIAKAPTGGTAADNGLVDLLAIDNRGTLLALERSFAVGQGNTIKIYEISLQGATDINTVDSLSSLTASQLAAIQPTQKRLILNLDTLSLPNSDGNHPTGTDNIEGLAFGPKLADGTQSIVLVSDNNFGATQFTQIVTLSADLVPTATPIVETRPALLDDGSLPFSQRADADDPAIYVNATDSSKSLVLTSVKNGGLRIYDLAGNLLQTINPSNPDIRYNNVDLQYGFTLGGQKVDIAVASDRNNDKLAIFKINPNSANGNYLENITDSNAATIFQSVPFAAPYSASTRSSYGLALYRSPVTNDYYVFTSRRQTGDIAQLKLVDKGNGKIGYEVVRSFTIPSPTTAGASAQTEGMVADQETGFLYIGQEDVGIWKFDAEPNGGSTGKLIEKVKAEGGKNLTNDVEGLTIYYGKNGTGYLLASSQGDNTFAAYTREGNNDFLGRFGVGNNGGIDSVQESDGADVINLPLGPNFPYGVFITQDGANDPATIVSGENISSNFKLVPWENIANALPTPLKIDTTSYDPRNPVPQARLTNYEFTNLPKLGTTSKGQDIFLGGFSGLYFQGIAPNGNLQFVTNTDRGPNGDPTGANRPFYLPDFQPEIVSFELNRQTGAITITKRTGLFEKDGTTPLTGLPNLQAGANGTAYTDEVAVNLDGQVIANKALGADVEGIVIAPNGDYWLVDEYRPAIYNFDVNGKLLNRYIPQGTATALEPDAAAGTFGTEVLPAVYGQRRNNRGFEAVALEGSKLYAFIQSAIDNPDNASDTTSRNSRNLRILEFDIISKQVTGEYLYLLDNITAAGNAKTDKLGDAVSLGNGKFAIVERDDLGTNASNKLIYQINLAGATNINNSANFTLPAGKTIEQLTPAELTTAKITPVSKSLIANAAQLGYTGVEKLEGLALVAPNTLALINDNDFNVSGNTPTEKLGILELPYNLTTPQPKPSLNILLVNDDGYQAKGINVLYDKLVAAGHKVTLVAPKTQQSGQGTAIDTDKVFQPIEVVNYAPNKWYVDGKPVIATWTGLDFVVKQRPDLVISGINEGENLGLEGIISGTLSAAVSAVHQGVPAIAVSAGIILSERATGYPSTDKAYQVGANYVVDLISQLQEKQGSQPQLLPDGIGLNVNIPADNPITGIAFTEFDLAGSFDFKFGQLPANFGTGQGILYSQNSLPAGATPKPTSEGEQFLADKITVTAFDGDWGTTASQRQALAPRLPLTVPNLVNPIATASKSLNILLVNDDGYQAKGIDVIYNALVAAGHNVILVAPKTQQSGKGTAINTDKIFQNMEVVEFDPTKNKWYVDGTPIVATWAGLDYILPSQENLAKPDLVISGINEGENVGFDAISSGTLSAAVTALQNGIPAIAVSAGINLAEFQQGNRSSTGKAYDVAARMVVDTINKLLTTQGTNPDLLPKGVGLNINVPAYNPDNASLKTLTGVALTKFDETTSLNFNVAKNQNGVTSILLGSPTITGDIESEGGKFLERNITITPIDGNWSASASTFQKVANDATPLAVNGIASGDTTQTSTVLWARSIFPGAVKFEYSTNSNFSNIAGTQTANVTDVNLPVKVAVSGLTPNTNYFYRVTDTTGATSIGKFSTAAVVGNKTGLKFGVSGDWRGELAPYPAVSNADDANLKFFVELGDTIYADVASPAVKNPDGTEKKQVITVDEYRAKQAEVYSQRYGENTLGDLRAATSIFATIDDHEVYNDFGGKVPTNYNATLTGDQELQKVTTAATGTASLEVSHANNYIDYSLTVKGLDFGTFLGITPQTAATADDVTGMHIHRAARGANGSVVFDPKKNDQEFKSTINQDGSVTFTGRWDSVDGLTSTLLNSFETVKSGADTNLYFNVHTTTNPGGEIRGQIVAGANLTNDSAVYENGLQAFQEYNPISDQFYGATGDSSTAEERKLYRYNTFGSDAATFVLDARSFRDSGLTDVANISDATQVTKFLTDSFNPNRTMLGKVQLDDLKRDLIQAQKDGITWKFIMLSQPIQNLGVAIAKRCCKQFAADRYEGYAAERTEILKFINDSKISNVVFVTADFHGTLVNNLTYQLAPGQAQIPTRSFEIITGSVAYDAPFGPTVGNFFLTPEQKAFYNSLPVANDVDSTVNDRDDFIKQVINGGINALGYDPIGLNNNLTVASGLIDAKLLQGDYIATHTYGWTEFNIDQATQKLTVTTYGIDPYTRQEVEGNPAAISSRQPKIVSQFEVTANNFVDLELSQTANVTNAVIGDQVTFTLTLSNKGSLLANGIKVTDLLPQPFTFISATPEQGTYNSQTGVWEVGEIAGNVTRTLKLTAKVTQSGALTNKAEITAQNQPDFDSGAGNNNAQEDDQSSTTLNIASNMVTLKGFASLPADTFAAGPSAGAAVTNPTNGRTTPFPGQPVQGFSGVQFAPNGAGSVFWFLADNGFGAKNNSADFLLRLYQVDPNFAGTENANGSVAVQNFIQLSDPNKLIPFDIVNKNTAKRELTGADFDVESFVIDAKGDIWVGDEFGTYLLHFNSNGVLLDAPFATPNLVKLNTLNGQAPIVIGHRGASGELPEHTIEAYRLAILRGADFIEPDLVSTKDGILIARHEPNLINTTDVASRPEFASRKKTVLVDGVTEEGFFASDFTLAEIKTLRAVMPQGFRDQLYNGLLQVPTLGEIIDLVKEVEVQTGKKIGIYPETKHPTYHDNLGLSLEEKLIDTLKVKGFTDPKRVFIQSFEVSNLKDLNNTIMPAAGVNLPLVQLLDAYDVANDGTLLYQDVYARPYDFTVKGDTRTYGDLLTPTGLKEIAAYADGIGPWKRQIVSVKTVDNNNDGKPDDLNNDGVINDADKVTLAPTSLVSDAHKEGLLVHPYTFRNESRSLASNYNNNPELEYRQFISLGVDGYFTDFPGTGDLVRDQITANQVRSPQNPTVLSTPKFDTLTGKAPIVIGHRGASGERPEHTIEAYKLAIAQGADFVEPDLVVTKDGVLIARHEPMLAVGVLNTDGTIQRDTNGKPVINTTDTSTDVYLRDKFSDRLKIKNLDGRNVAGWFAEDFTLAEVKELNAIERIPALRGTTFDQDGLKVPTLKEVIDLVKQVELETGRKIGIYPETKHPTFFQQQGINTSQILADTLKAENFTDPSRIFIQSFEVANLKALKNTIMPTAGIDIPLVQLFGGSGRPYDFVVSGDTRTYTDISTPAGLTEIATYAKGIGPNKQRIIPQLTVDANKDGTADDLNGDGQISDGDRVLGTPTTLIQDAHKAGLIVHLYTLRNDEFFLPDTYKNDPGAEFRKFIDLGVDGFFTDFPKTGRQVLVNNYLAGTGYANPNGNLNTPYFNNSPEYFAPNQPYYGDLVTANLNRSQGFEGMAFSPDRQTIYPMLEGTVVGDSAGSVRIYKFDVASESYQGLVGRYQLASTSNAIGDFTPINNNEFLVIERDNGQGSTALFKKIFKVDFSKIDANGFVSKEEVANLLNIQDTNDLNGDGKTTYDMPFQTIEDVLVIDSKTILVANDNNYPFSIGRPPAIDNNEMVVLELDKPLALDSRLGISASIAEATQYIAGTTGKDDLFVSGGTDGIKDTIFTGAGNDTVDTVLGAISPFAGNNIVDSGSGDDTIFVNKGDRAFGSDGNDTFDARDGQGGNRISGGVGDDTFYLGSNDRALGGDGKDIFRVSLGGGNLISGGAGADQFWIVNAELPSSANTVLDFQLGTDVIGISGAVSLGITTSTLKLNQVGADTAIVFNNQTLATLTGIQASSLSLTDPKQFILA